jgi:hypothetical protein
MLIECLIRRKAGSTVEMDGNVYKFQPDESGAHVCYVAVPSHAKRLLDIPHGYRRADGKQIELLPPDTDEQERMALLGNIEKATGKRPHHKTGLEKLRAIWAELEAAANKEAE